MLDITHLIGIAYLLNIVIIIAIVCFEKRNPISSTAWILCLILFPALGGILFLIFGVGLRSYARYRYKKKQEMNENYILRTQKEIANSRIEDEHPDSALVRYFLNCNCVFTPGNKVDIFTDAGKKYEALFADIESAKESINITYFIIRNDNIGNRLIDLLTKKANEGVKVRLMYDGFGSILTPRRLFNRLRNAEASEVVEFFPVHLFSMSKINHRNHRKIVVVDDRIAYLGGMNIGDEYMSKSAKRKLPWRDTHIRIEGDAVQYVQHCFAQDWEFSTGDTFAVKEENTEKAGDVAMQIVASGPDSAEEEIKCGMIRMLYGANRYAYIQTPYFVPDEAFLQAVRTAAESGVDVRVMIPGMPDKKYVYHTTMSYVGELLDAGVKVYLYPGFIHSKTICVDDRVSTIGSTNIDIRSFRLLFELNAFMYSPSAAMWSREIFEKDMEICRELTMEEYKKRGIIKIIKEGFFRLFSPIL